VEVAVSIAQGTVLRADCGAEIVYSAGCPDDAVVTARCACGSEFVPVADGDRIRPRAAATAAP
jgi:hypothetical protein